MLLVVTDRLTIGQLTFILRVIIQTLTYGGAFLLGLIILGHSPSVAVVETHDVINRTVGKSTATSSSIRWIKSRLIGKKKNDGYTSKFLLIAVLLSLLYGLFATLSDVGFIGFESCDISGRSFNDFPASIRSVQDAERMMETRMLNGTKPSEVNAYRCDAAEDRVLPETNTTVRMCTAWRNSTYADVSAFRQLNLTDTDALMPHLMQRWQSTIQDVFDLNTYFLGSTGAPFPKATVNDGLAIVPHDTGVTTILGVPELPRFSKVTIPKTMAALSSVGCLPIGMIGSRLATSISPRTYDYLTVDSVWAAKREAAYVGPQSLYPILVKYAEQSRDYLRPWFNETNRSGDLIRSFNQSNTNTVWQTIAGSWFFPDTSQAVDHNDAGRFIRGNCTADIHDAVKALRSPEHAIFRQPEACAFYQIRGSFVADGAVVQGFTNFICGTTTQINMVSATVAVDGEGKVTYESTNLPSDIHETTANYYDVTNAKTGLGDGPTQFDPIVRYTLSDNPNGATEHYVVQDDSLGLTARSLTQGAGSVGAVLRRAGAAMMSFDSLEEDSLGMINSTYFSIEQVNATLLTRWVGAIGASYLQGSLAFNPFSAVDTPSFEVQSTGGKVAICYRPQYAAAFVPLAVAAFVVLVWAGLLAFGGRITGTKKMEKMYGGLSPAIVAPYPVKPGQDEVLAWQHGPQPHLTPLSPDTPRVGGEGEYLLNQINTGPQFPTPHFDSK